MTEQGQEQGVVTITIDALLQKIGHLTMENDMLRQKIRTLMTEASQVKKSKKEEKE